MNRYIIEQTATGVVLFDGVAESEADALDLMAMDAGYRDYASIPPEIGGGDTIKVRGGGEMTITNIGEALKIADALQDFALLRFPLGTEADIADRELICKAARLIYELCGMDEAA